MRGSGAAAASGCAEKPPAGRRIRQRGRLAYADADSLDGAAAGAGAAAFSVGLESEVAGVAELVVARESLR